MRTEATATLKSILQTTRHLVRDGLNPERLTHLRSRVRYQTGILGVFALMAALLLSVVDFATHDTIQARLAEDLKASLDDVIPVELHDNDLLADVVTLPSADAGIGANETTVYLARKQGRTTAVGFELVAPDGYAGPIRLVMGIDRHGEILGARVIAHVETPGLGDKIEVSKSKWILNFNGKSLDNLTLEQWAVKKDGGVFDQFAGATITPRKVVQAIRRGLAFYQIHRETLVDGDD